MKSLRFALLAGCAFAAAATTSASAFVSTADSAAVAPQADEASKLAALFAEDDEATLKRNPLNALFRGDMRYADQLGDYISDAYFDAERKAAEANLAKLESIDRAKLDPTSQIAFDVTSRTSLMH